ncbi:MAG: hypothetical protein WCF57_17685 [Pyrinomonadaceae bacterium]
MSGLTFTKDPESALPNKPLDDANVGPKLIGGSASYDGEHKLGGVKFGFGVEGNASVTAFNSLDDKDDDGVLGRPTAAGSELEVTLPPQIELTEEEAWLKYRYEATAKASVGGAVSIVEFKIDGSKKAVFTDYHRHARDENTQAAFLSDLTALRFAAVPDDVLELREREALSYQIHGELSANVTLSWADVFTAGMSSLSQLLKSGQLLAIKISAAASVKFDVGLVDDFRVVFTKGSGNNVVVAVKKSDSREVGVAASLGVTVKFADEAAVQKVLSDLVESFAGEQVAVIDDLFNKATFADLTDEQRAIIDAVSERLGLGGVGQTLASMKERWEALKKRVEETITKIAKAKVELGFTYEYLRVSKEDTLLVAELDQETFKACHNDLMLCDIRPMLDWVKDHPAALKNYLNQKSLKRSKAWGFSLGIGPWNLGGKDQKELTRTVQTNIEERQRVAYRGMRGYTGKWLSDTTSWTVDFKADMKEFSKDQTPTTCEFQYGLHFKWLWDQKNLEKKELLEFLDCAVVWRILNHDDVDEAIEKIGDKLNQTAQTSVEFTIEDSTLRALLPIIAAADINKADETNLDAVYRAFGKAMPYMDGYDARRLPNLREACYAPLWKYYFENNDMSDDMFPKIAGLNIEKIAQALQIKAKGLGTFEKGIPGKPESTYTNPYTFSGQIHLNGYTGHDYTGIYKHWVRFASGLSRLRNSLETGKCAPGETINEVFKDLSSFWGQSFFVRAAGIYLLDTAAANGDLLKQINGAVTVTFADDEVFTFAASR